MKRTYRHVADHEEFTLGNVCLRRGGKGVMSKLACCDCGLTHMMKYRLTKKGVLAIIAVRDNRASATIRRARGTLVHSVAARMSASSGKNRKAR